MEDMEDTIALPSCRICLEPSNAMDTQLVSPCACRGTQAFVHYWCLRQWQMTVMADHGPYGVKESHAYVCNVCTERFTIPPPQRPLGSRLARKLSHILRGGCFLFLTMTFMSIYALEMKSLLLYNESPNEREWSQTNDDLTSGTLLVASRKLPSGSSLFHKSVVLLYEHSEAEGSFGVILNKPTEAAILEGGASDLPQEIISSLQFKTRTFWGGPVATRIWMLLRRCPECAKNPPCTCGCSRPVLEGAKWRKYIGPGLCLDSDLSGFLEGSRKAANLSEIDSPGVSGEDSPENIEDVSNLLLLGRAGWAWGQLAAEIRAGWWSVKLDALEEILNSPTSGLWDAMK